VNDFSANAPVLITGALSDGGVISVNPAETLHGRLETEAATKIREEANALVQAAVDTIQEKRYTVAIALLRRAIALAPNFGLAWAELGVALHALGKFEDCIFVLEKAISLIPNYENAKSNLALVRGILGDYDRAESEMRRLADIPERSSAESIHLSLMLLAKGDWEEGLRLHEWRVGGNMKEFKLPRLGVPYWDGSDLNGKTFFIQTEQGIGDSIAFIRYVHWVKQKYPDVRIKLNVHTSYQNLFWEFREIVEFVPSGILWPDQDGPERYDWGVYLHSLAYFAGARPDNIYPDPGYTRKRVAAQNAAATVNMPLPSREGCLKVGVVWTGNPENATQARRSVPIEHILHLATDPRNVLYSLQCGPGHDDLGRTGAYLVMEDLRPHIESDLVLTGIALMQMDVVVTCCTMVAHLAGALGVRCFVMLCYDAYWLWGKDPDTTPWYPSVRLFRQKKRGDWNQVISDVSEALKEI
jgi:hypothetical protein